MRVTCARVACVALAVAVAADWTARGGSDVFVMWLMAPFLLAAAARSVPAVLAAAVPAVVAALAGPARLAAGPADIDPALVAVTASVLGCSVLVLAAEALRRRPAMAGYSAGPTG